LSAAVRDEASKPIALCHISSARNGFRRRPASANCDLPQRSARASRRQRPYLEANGYDHVSPRSTEAGFACHISQIFFARFGPRSRRCAMAVFVHPARAVRRHRPDRTRSPPGSSPSATSIRRIGQPASGKWSLIPIVSNIRFDEEETALVTAVECWVIRPAGLADR
jgi:hypothetical protein